MRSRVDVRSAVIAQRRAVKVRRIAQVHAASLRDQADDHGQAGPDKQKPPEMAISEGFTTRKTLLEVPGGRSPKCA